MKGADFVRLRADFPLLTKRINGHRLAYLDSAATTQKPLEVIEALRRYKAALDRSFVMRDMRTYSRAPHFLDNQRLFKQYPELTNVRVKTHYRDTDGSTGVFNDKDRTISLAHDMTPEAAKDTLIHEIQHWVQKKEGFARGGSGDNPDYPRLHGEIESTDSADRRTWDALMRREVPPTTREDAIIRFGDKGAEEIERELLR